MRRLMDLPTRPAASAYCARILTALPVRTIKKYKLPETAQQEATLLRAKTDESPIFELLRPQYWVVEQALRKLDIAYYQWTLAPATIIAQGRFSGSAQVEAACALLVEQKRGQVTEEELQAFLKCIQAVRPLSMQELMVLPFYLQKAAVDLLAQMMDEPSEDVEKVIDGCIALLKNCMEMDTQALLCAHSKTYALLCADPELAVASEQTRMQTVRGVFALCAVWKINERRLVEAVCMRGGAWHLVCGDGRKELAALMHARWRRFAGWKRVLWPLLAYAAPPMGGLAIVWICDALPIPAVLIGLCSIWPLFWMLREYAMRLLLRITAPVPLAKLAKVQDEIVSVTFARLSEKELPRKFWEDLLENARRNPQATFALAGKFTPKQTAWLHAHVAQAGREGIRVCCLCVEPAGLQEQEKIVWRFLQTQDDALCAQIGALPDCVRYVLRCAPGVHLAPQSVEQLACALAHPANAPAFAKDGELCAGYLCVCPALQKRARFAQGHTLFAHAAAEEEVGLAQLRQRMSGETPLKETYLFDLRHAEYITPSVRCALDEGVRAWTAPAQTPLGMRPPRGLCAACLVLLLVSYLLPGYMLLLCQMLALAPCVLNRLLDIYRTLGNYLRALGKGASMAETWRRNGRLLTLAVLQTALLPWHACGKRNIAPQTRVQYYRDLWSCPVFGGLQLACCICAGGNFLTMSVAWLLLFSATPLAAHFVAAAFTPVRKHAEQTHMLAAFVWSYFADKCIAPTARGAEMCDEIGAWSIACSLAAPLCAFRFGFISARDACAHLHHQAQVLAQLPRQNGLFYDTYMRGMPTSDRIPTAANGAIAICLAACAQGAQELCARQNQAAILHGLRALSNMCGRVSGDVYTDVHVRMLLDQADELPEKLRRIHVFLCQVGEDWQPLKRAVRGQLDGRPADVRALCAALQKLAGQMNFTVLYDAARGLFFEDNLRAVHCEQFASKSVLASFWAIASGQISPEHWERLARPLVQIRFRRAFISAQGDADDYFSALLLPLERYDPLWESVWAAMEAQLPGGRATVCMKDGWKTFGTPSLALQYPQTEIAAPHVACMRALLHGKKFMKSLFFNFGPAEWASENEWAQIQTAAHAGMLLMTADAALHDGGMRTNFEKDGRARAFAYLLAAPFSHESAVLRAKKR